jgi:hypothetical protein
MVYDKYPFTKLEKSGCVSEKSYMDGKRVEYAKRIINEQPKEKIEYK